VQHLPGKSDAEQGGHGSATSRRGAWLPCVRVCECANIPRAVLVPAVDVLPAIKVLPASSVQGCFLLPCFSIEAFHHTTTPTQSTWHPYSRQSQTTLIPPSPRYGLQSLPSCLSVKAPLSYDARQAAKLADRRACIQRIQNPVYWNIMAQSGTHSALASTLPPAHQPSSPQSTATRLSQSSPVEGPTSAAISSQSPSLL
jgi:hypothetical protein